MLIPQDQTIENELRLIPMTTTTKLFFIAILTAFAASISAPKDYPLNFNLFGKEYSYIISSPTINIEKPFQFSRDLNIKKGLDLQGGIEVILEANMDDLAQSDRQDALDSAREVLSRRIDLYGISESSIKTLTTDTSYRISVALPGIDDPQAALDLIGQTAQLDFRELPEGTDSASILDFVPTGLTGKDLKKSTVQFDQNDGTPAVGIEFTKEGGEKFGDITENNIGKPLAIFLDNFPISVPSVQNRIDGGQASITGNFTIEEAKNLAITLNAGALPVPIEIISQQNIAPTLGEESVNKSIRAGAVGLAMVALFMVLLYGKLGFIADIGLLIYGLITLAVYKLIPITLTLPGLAGFILSIGMAVDANILIFERMKEEIRKGHQWQHAMELGFGRAWDSIKDANIATLITTFILFNPLEWNFLNTSGMIRGFALTLFLGIIISLFTGVFVTRTLLRAYYVQEK